MRGREQRSLGGFALIEVLAAAGVLAVVLLGSGLTLLGAVRALDSARQRTEASLLALDLLERIRANASMAEHYAMGPGEDSTTESEASSCPSGAPCDPAMRAAADVAEWRARVSDTLRMGSADVEVIETDDARLVHVVLLWMDSASGQAQRLALPPARVE